MIPAIRGTALLALLAAPFAGSGEDWLQWGGPGRDFKVAAPRLAASWKDSPPRRLWTRPLGEGYSAIAASGEALWTMVHKEGREAVVSLKAATGDTLWEFAYEAPLLPGMAMENGAGPHASPLVQGGRVFAMGATGILTCLGKDTGKRCWQRSVLEEFKGTVLGRGYSASPIAYEGTVIVPAGGPDHAVIAFRQEDGSMAWHKHSFRISHASPVLIRFRGRDQLAAIFHQQMVGIDPRNGDLLWSLPQPTIGDHIASTPLWDGTGRLFFSCAYDGGTRCIELSDDAGATRARELWFTSKMRIHHSNGMFLGDRLLGSSGDFGAVLFSAIDPASGEVLWKDRGIGRANGVLADGKLILLDEEGTLFLADTSRQGLTILDRFELLKERAWTPPTLAGKRLYVRTRKAVLALELP